MEGKYYLLNKLAEYILIFVIIVKEMVPFQLTICRMSNGMQVPFKAWFSL